MMTEQQEAFREFLSKTESEQVEWLSGIKLHWWERLELRYYIWWWSQMRRSNPTVRAEVLWESIIKGRF